MANNKDNHRHNGGGGGYDSCSFCGRSAAEVGMLFSGMNGATICDECVERGYDVLQEQSTSKKKNKNASASAIKQSDLMKPTEIKAFLDRYVIGQDAAKRTLAVAVYNHYKRLLAAQDKQND